MLDSQVFAALNQLEGILAACIQLATNPNKLIQVTFETIYDVAGERNIRILCATDCMGQMIVLYETDAAHHKVSTRFNRVYEALKKEDDMQEVFAEETAGRMWEDLNEQRKHNPVKP